MTTPDEGRGPSEQPNSPEQNPAEQGRYSYGQPSGQPYHPPVNQPSSQPYAHPPYGQPSYSQPSYGPPSGQPGGPGPYAPGAGDPGRSSGAGRRRPVTLLISRIIQLVVAGLVLVFGIISGIVVANADITQLISAEELAELDNIAPSDYDTVMTIVSVLMIVGAIVVALLYVLLGLMGTKGGSVWRILDTVFLGLVSVLVLFFGVINVLLVSLPSLAALVLLWLPASSQFIQQKKAASTAPAGPGFGGPNGPGMPGGPGPSAQPGQPAQQQPGQSQPGQYGQPGQPPQYGQRYGQQPNQQPGQYGQPGSPYGQPPQS